MTEVSAGAPIGKYCPFTSILCPLIADSYSQEGDGIQFKFSWAQLTGPVFVVPAGCFVGELPAKTSSVTCTVLSLKPYHWQVIGQFHSSWLNFLLRNTQ